MKTVPTEDCDVLMTFPGMHTCLPSLRRFVLPSTDPLASVPLGRHH